MANANRPTGLSPTKSLSNSYQGQMSLYAVASDYATALAVGDPVKTVGTASADGYPTIERAAAGDPIRGVIQGLGTSKGLIANPSDLDTTVRPANPGVVWYALVVDDPSQIYTIQASSALSAADIGLNADVLAGADNGFVSGFQLGTPTALGATAQLRILGLVDTPDNEFGLYAKVLVKINEDELTSTTGT